jgi:hypothetical protein
MSRCVVLAIVVGLAACGGPDADAICQERESCHHGNELDVDACVVSFSTSQDLADDLGCGDEFDVYFECFQTAATCIEQSLGLGCGDDADCNGGSPTSNARCQDGTCVDQHYDIEDPEACKTERAAYQSCVVGG